MVLHYKTVTSWTGCDTPSSSKTTVPENMIHIKYGFTRNTSKHGLHWPQCVLCCELLLPRAWNTQLRQALYNIYPSVVLSAAVHVFPAIQWHFFYSVCRVKRIYFYCADAAHVWIKGEVCPFSISFALFTMSVIYYSEDISIYLSSKCN